MGAGLSRARAFSIAGRDHRGLIVAQDDNVSSIEGTMSTTVPNAARQPFSTAYTRYVLGIVFLIQIFNNVDRTVLSILVEPIKRDFDMSDTQMGAAMGLAFTIVYTLTALPVARWADFSVRRSIVAGALFIWSGFTAVTALVQNFTQLFMARMGIGIGEAGGLAPSLSLLSDYLPPERRGRGLSVVSMGAVTGMGLGMVVGGWINEEWGWRWAFVAAGLPGMALAGIVRWTVREPARGASEGGAPALDRDSSWGVLKHMLGIPCYVCIVVANAFSIFAVMGRNLWEPSFIIRSYEMGTADAGMVYFLTSPMPSMLGIYLGGMFADRLALRDRRWYLWVPAIGQALSIPMLCAFLLWPNSDRVSLPFGLPEIPVAFLFSIVGSVFSTFFTAPFLATIQSLAKLRMRAMAAAISSTVSSFVGMCAGPLLVGVMSDAFEMRFGQEALRYSLLVPTIAPIGSIVFCLLAARAFRSDTTT
jgi:MFS family permease